MPSLVDTLTKQSMSEREKRIADTEGLDAQATAILKMLARCADNTQTVYEYAERHGDPTAPLIKHWATGAGDAFDHAFLALKEEGLL